MNKALFIDRDGTIIEHVPYLSDPDLVKLVPGVSDALLRARQSGYLLFVFTNQSGIGRGYYEMDVVLAVNSRVEELLDLPAPTFDGICIAPESPDDPVEYRKPSPRFIEEMIEKHNLNPKQCHMIGDARSDILAGMKAGINSAAVVSPGHDGSEFPEVKSGKVRLFASLTGFIDNLLG